MLHGIEGSNRQGLGLGSLEGRGLPPIGISTKKSMRIEYEGYQWYIYFSCLYKANRFFNIKSCNLLAIITSKMAENRKK